MPNKQACGDSGAVTPPCAKTLKFCRPVVTLNVFDLIGCEVYNVGDSAGWTIIDAPDYKKWAASKTFHVGDKIVFNYDKENHDVVQVSYSDFISCKISKQIAKYTTGNDTINITTRGHYYFICSVPGHCEHGQKVDIRVVNSAPSAGPAPPSKAPTPSPKTPAPPASSAPPAVSPTNETSKPHAPATSQHNGADLPSKGALVTLVMALLVLVGVAY